MKRFMLTLANIMLTRIPRGRRLSGRSRPAATTTTNGLRSMKAVQYQTPLLSTYSQLTVFHRSFLPSGSVCHFAQCKNPPRLWGARGGSGYASDHRRGRLESCDAVIRARELARSRQKPPPGSCSHQLQDSEAGWRRTLKIQPRTHMSASRRRAHPPRGWQ